MMRSVVNIGLIAVCGWILADTGAAGAEEQVFQAAPSGSSSEYVIDADEASGAAQYMIETAAHAIRFGQGIGAEMAAAIDRLEKAKAALTDGSYEEAANAAHEALGEAEQSIAEKQLDITRSHLFEIYTLKNQHGLELNKDDQYEISVIRDAMDKGRAEFAMNRAKSLLEQLRDRAPTI